MTYTALDLFAGAGGATQGLRDAGFTVLGAIENDRSAARSYRLNHSEVRLWDNDIRSIPAQRAMRELGLQPGELTLLKTCPPCQGYSSMAEGRATIDERRNDLVMDTIRFARAFKPRAILLENVPGLARDARSTTLVSALERLGYSCRTYVVNAVDFGVPQRRRRLIILALRGLRHDLPDTLGGEATDEAPDVSVRSALRALAENRVEDDELDISRAMSAMVRRRVSAVPVGGTRFDLPPELQLACHVRLDTGPRSATGSYGRIKLDGPAPTMTTRCTTPACGTFIHPTEDRGLTLREAASIQTFPHGYRFAGTYGEIERQIGNAVPVRMASELAKVIVSLLD